MNKQAFLDALYHHLKALPKAERQQHIDYYAEMIDDRMEEGLSEEEAVAGIGSVEEVARTIIAETPVYPQPPSPQRPKSSAKACAGGRSCCWFWAALFGCPCWWLWWPLSSLFGSACGPA